MKISNENQSIILSSLDLGVPPVLKSLDNYIETIFKDIDSLDIHNTPTSECITKREVDYEACYFVDVSQPQSFINVEHDPVSGELIGFVEESISEGAGKSSKYSLSLDRQPCHLSEGIRGSNTNCPFLPGGFDLNENKKKVCNAAFDFKDLLTTPPNFSNGCEFERKDIDWLEGDTLDILKGFDEGIVDSSISLRRSGDTKFKNEYDKHKKISEVVVKLEHRIENTLSPSSSMFVKGMGGGEKDEYAVVVDLLKPIHDFNKFVNPIITYPFELDTFQKQAIIQMEAKNNVFVAAHTSAGKTVVAEYSIALALNHMTKAIYTSPIKALSNQKFRDFKVKFGDVGLVTGDVQINPEASVLIMTTEILRSMLYNGSDVIRDLEWVIFDEVHYINDPERGVVWEEVLILLPETVKIVLLSATVPNSRQFAEWVGRIKKKKVYVISTPKRPVPLEHFLYTGNSSSTSNELFMLIDSESNFQTAGYNKALEAKRKRVNKALQQYGGKKANYAVKSKQEQQIWSSLIQDLHSVNKTPAVAFIFSKRRIDDNCANLKKLDLLTSNQKSCVTTFFKKSIKLLKPVDQNLPQVVMLEELLKRGIGMHHSGILPILKEIVEMLFQRGLVKVLFATETFAMGVNMPAKTVIFDSIQKHDGQKLRDLLPGEYIQMAGRAGRRGLDKTGTVIILCKNEVPELSDLHKMMQGQATQLTSKFRVTYLMVLNLLRVEELRVEDMMSRSFGEFVASQTTRHLKEKVKRLQEKYDGMVAEEKEEKEEKEEDGEDSKLFSNKTSDLAFYYESIKKYHSLLNFIRDNAHSKMNPAKVLTHGRLLVLRRVGAVEEVAGVLLANNTRDKVLSVFVLCDAVLLASVKRIGGVVVDGGGGRKEDSVKPSIDLKVYKGCGEDEMVERIIEVKMEGVEMVCSKVIKVNASQIIDDVKRREMMRYSNDPPTQHTTNLKRELQQLIDDDNSTEMKLDLTDPESFDSIKKMQALKISIQQSPISQLSHSASFIQQFEKYAMRKRLEDEIRSSSRNLNRDYMQLFPEYYQRIDVLKQLNFVDKNNIVRLKGRVACEINVQELMVTELIFQNTFNNLSPEEIASLLSCLVFQQSRCSEPKLSAKLKKVKESLIVMARGLTGVQRIHGIMVDDLEEQCNCGLMQVIHEWALGMPFSQIMDLTDVQEGVIVKCIQRLDDLFHDLVNVARVIGDPVLGKKMEEGSRLIKRDIVFAASLYLQ